MLVYTALGDSITYGEMATSPCFAYPSRVVAKLRNTRGTPAVGEVLAEPGWTCEALATAVFSNPATTLAQSNTISIFVGGDNLAAAGLALYRGARKSVLAASLRNYGESLGRLIGGIRRVSKAKIIVCTQYNPFPNSPLAVQGISALNGVSETIAKGTQCVIAPVHAAFVGREALLISGYRTGRLQDVLTSNGLPIHPNDAGHAVIADSLFATMR